MITKATIKRHAGSTTFNRGTDIQRMQKVYEFDANVYYDPFGDEICELTAIVEGSHHNDYEVNITVNETTSEIVDYYCDCPAYDTYFGLCKHCVAVLLEYLMRRKQIISDISQEDLNNLLGEWNVAKGVKVKKRTTNQTLKNLIAQSELRENAVYLPECKAGQVHLEPYIVQEYNGMFVEFKIGIQQMYVLKDIFHFVKDMEEMNTVKYGKKLEFLHSMDAFDEESKLLVRTIVNEVLSSRDYEYYKQYGFLIQGTARKLVLQGQFLEQIMLALEGRRVSVTFHRGNEVNMLIQKASPQIKMYIRGEEDGVVIIAKPECKMVGNTYIYTLIEKENPRICITERKEIQKINQFLEYVDMQNGKEIFIAKEDMVPFCKNMLPVLEKYFNIVTENFMPEKYLPEEVKFQIYLDAPQNDMISCKVLGIYGTEQYNIFEPQDALHSNMGRDMKKEGFMKASVMKYFYAYDPSTKEMVLQGEDDIYRFLTEGIESMHTLGEVFISEKLKRIQVISKVKVQVGVSLSSNLLQLNISNDYFSKSELAEILSKYEKKKKYYRLKSGEFIRMDEEGMQALYDLKENFQLTDKEWNADTITVPGYRALYLDQRLKGEGVQVQKNKEFKQLIRNMKTIEDNDFEIPLELEAVLREYQKTGFLWMKTLCKNQFGGILADDMGLGKTLQTITFLLSEFQEAGEEPRKAIIITPASLVYNWKNEFEKFAPQLNVHTVTGTLKERRALMDTLENQAILITSYQLLYRDEELYEKMSFDYQIIDEAQFIKNQGNQTTKAVKDIQARFRLALTGTPVENKLSELWSIFDYVMPGFLYKYQRFRKEIETPIVKNQNQEIMQRLQKMIQPFVLRRTKKEVLKELPDKIEKCMYAVLEGEQKSLYQAHAQRLQMQLSKQTDEEFQSSQIQILAELTRLRQLCCDPGTFYENYKGGSAKLDLCMQLVENAMESGHKILLFSQFTTMLDKIAQELDKRGIAHYMLTGRTKKLERVQMAEAFNQDDTPIFCISLKAGGTGLNLTGADMVIHFDPWWNAAVETQATDRAHRIGQKQVVTVYKLIASNTLEERIMELQNKKKELASQVLGGEGISRAKFSKEELLSLLE